MGETRVKSNYVTQIVSIGGGYGAIYLLKALRGAIRKKQVRLTIIDRNNYHCFHGLVPEVLTGKIEAGNILSSSRRIFSGAEFINAEVENIDFDSRQITISRSLDGKQFLHPYDHLVFNAGSKEDLTRFSGVSEHTMCLKTFPDILAVRHHVISMLELANIETDPEEQESLLTFVVVGGNYAGVEVSSEFSDFLPRIVRKNFPNVPVEKIRIVLVHSGEHLLPELGQHYPSLQKYAENTLGNRHLEVCTGIRMESATPEEAILDDGSKIKTRTIISCTGIKPHTIIKNLPFPKDSINRLVTDEFLNVEGESNIWACGDCAAVPHPDGGNCPPLAIWAMTAGRQVGKNILLRLRGNPLQRYRFNGLGDACTLGKWTAIAHLKGFKIYGFPAFLIWRFFMILYLPAKEKKLRTLWDWCLGLVFGRDIVNMDLSQRIGVESAIFEAGQTIIREGEIGRTMFLIKSGEVDVIKGGSTLVRTLKTGDHFGELAIFNDSRRAMTVRAKTKVELVVILRDAAVALKESLSGTDEMLRTPWTTE